MFRDLASKHSDLWRDAYFFYRVAYAQIEISAIGINGAFRPADIKEIRDARSDEILVDPANIRRRPADQGRPADGE